MTKQRPRIAIDAHALGTQAGGNETFVRQLLEGLRAVSPDTDIVALVHTGAPEGLTSGFPAYPMQSRSSWLRVPFGLPAAVRATHADLLHVQYIAPPVCPVPFVVTLHDMVWKRFPETLRTVDRMRLAALVPGTLRRAARVFVVSEAMKREAMAFYGVPESKIDVVYNSVDPLYRPVADPERLAAVRARYGLPERYVAYMGQLQPRKNVLRLAEAFARLQGEAPHALVFIGKQSWRYREIGEGLERLHLGERLRFTGYVEQEDLPALLSAADVFAYLSLYEGFGLPVAEAMACGTPVLTSTDPALSEVAGGAALTCDPMSVDDIEAALRRLLLDEGLRKTLALAGPERAKCFARESMARAALAGYENALA